MEFGNCVTVGGVRLVASSPLCKQRCCLSVKIGVLAKGPRAGGEFEPGRFKYNNGYVHMHVIFHRYSEYDSIQTLTQFFYSKLGLVLNVAHRYYSGLEAVFAQVVDVTFWSVTSMCSHFGFQDV